MVESTVHETIVKEIGHNCSENDCKLEHSTNGINE
jgi:hypothetical protein